MTEKRITEAESPYRNLERMSVTELLRHMNDEDKKVATAVSGCLPQIEKLVNAICAKMKQAGRLIYMGAGTSGRLGILDASECVPTFGVAEGTVIGLIAGGDNAIRNPVEHAEDDITMGWQDLQKINVNKNDVVVGISASGTTPYVLGAIDSCRKHQIITGSISCNHNSPMSAAADHPVEVIVGPEFITGSSRMKAGSAEKMILNMISTAVMIQLGRVEDNKMTYMQLSNNKLIERGIGIILSRYHIDKETARNLLMEFKSVKKTLDYLESKK